MSRERGVSTIFFEGSTHYPLKHEIFPPARSRRLLPFAWPSLMLTPKERSGPLEWRNGWRSLRPSHACKREKPWKNPLVALWLSYFYPLHLPRTYTVAFGDKIAEMFDQLPAGRQPLRNPQAWPFELESHCWSQLPHACMGIPKTAIPQSFPGDLGILHKATSRYFTKLLSQRLVSPELWIPYDLVFKTCSLSNIYVRVMWGHPLISFWGYWWPGQWRSFWPGTASCPHPVRTLGCGPDGFCCKLPQFEQVPSHPRPIHRCFKPGGLKGP